MNNDKDDLRAARGIANGCLLSILFWAAVFVIVFAI
jgi:hypothetical protein